MSNGVGMIAILAAIVGVMNQMSWLSADVWYAGWVAVVLAAVAGIIAFMNQ